MKDVVIGYSLILALFISIGYGTWYFVLRDIFG